MNEIVKHSIFIKCNKIAIYSFRIERSRFDYHGTSEAPTKAKKYNPKDNEVICTINIPMPLLAEGDDFFLEDIKEIVTIQKVMRTSNDNVAYVVSVNIEDDAESLEKYEKEKQAFLDKKDLMKELEQYKRKYSELLDRKLFDRILNKRQD